MSQRIIVFFMQNMKQPSVAIKSKLKCCTLRAAKLKKHTTDRVRNNSVKFLL